jgi:hypothetical protein
VSSRLSRIPGARIGVRYLLTSLGFWVFFNTGMLIWHRHFEAFYFREPSILALTHLAALGWLTTGLMGVMYATLPATLGVRPNSLRMARVQYWLQVVGIAGLALTMSLVPQTRGRVVCGLLTLGALVIFVHNIAATVGRGKAWRLPEAHFVMAVFYLAITGLIGMSYVFYLNSGYVPQTMISLKVHAHFAGLGWLALTLMGLTYKLLPLELGVDHVPQRWSLAASMLINVVFWGVFFGYAYDWPSLRVGSAVLGLASLVCYTIQVRVMSRLAPDFTPYKGGFFANVWTQRLPPLLRGEGQGGGEQRPSSLLYTEASCAFGILTALLALLLTTGAVGDSFAVEYAYGYAAGAGWFGLYVTGQTAWLIPLLLHDDAHARVFDPEWMHLEFPGQVAGTVLVTIGLLAGVSQIVALGAAVNLVASLLLTIRSLRLRWAQPAKPHVTAGV